MTFEYGKMYWSDLWEKLEQEGNVGLDYVINPHLYPEVASALASSPKAIVVDFGCGTNLMGIQLLYGHADSIVALKDVRQLNHARFNAMLYLGLEGQGELVERSRAYLKDLGSPVNIATINTHIGDSNKNLFDAHSIDLCVSRNFLMHLSVENYGEHLRQVYEMLKPGGQYIFATLNPAYELAKAGRALNEGERYEFAHGKSGEYGAFYHFYKTTEQYESAMKEFDLIKKIPCLPVSERFRATHTRYYDPETPVAFVYVLKK